MGKTKLVFLICLNVFMCWSMVAAMGLEVAKEDPQAPSGLTRGGRKVTLNKIPEEIWKAEQANEDNVSHAESDYLLQQSDSSESE
jgi:hypothetical protein